MCVDKDYKVTTYISIREVLDEYGKIYGIGDANILINDDKLYFNWS